MKNLLSTYIRPLYFSRKWYAAFTAVTVLFVIRFFINWLGILPYLSLLILFVFFCFEYYLLFRNSNGIFGSRTHAERFSNGDQNPVQVHIQNKYPFDISAEVIDEVPIQFQRRDILFTVNIKTGENVIIDYDLRPVKRGSYHFGTVNIFVTTRIGFVIRRYCFEQPADVPVYPSYIQMRKYQLMAISNRLTEAGIKKIRRIGHSMEFEQVKEYVRGDDYRSLNWKATARKGQLMVNNFSDEKSQQVYCIIDKGRVMKMPFEGMSLLDYAINAALVLCNVALLKEDKAGLVMFSEQAGAFLAASRKAVQMHAVVELLYHQKTRYLESDFENLYSVVRRRISQRSLLVLFTNFETLSGMRRHLPYLKRIAAHHLLLVVFFENTELQQAATAEATDIATVYLKATAEKFIYEKKQIARELQQYGILSIITPPKDLTVNTLNKYLEIKAKQAI